MEILNTFKEEEKKLKDNKNLNDEFKYSQLSLFCKAWIQICLIIEFCKL